MKLYCDCGQKIISRIGLNKYARRPEHTLITLSVFTEEAEVIGGVETKNKIKRESKVKMPICKTCAKKYTLEDTDKLFKKRLPDMAKKHTLTEIEKKKDLGGKSDRLFRN